MYKIKRSLSTDGTALGAIIPLANIRQSCMLIPRFSVDGSESENRWRAANVLDEAETFYINNWLNSYTYQTIW
jgi:hypothetical protein